MKYLHSSALFVIFILFAACNSGGGNNNNGGGGSPLPPAPPTGPAPGTGSGPGPASAVEPNFMLFTSYASPGTELWRSDGTPGGTYAISNHTDKVVSTLNLDDFAKPEDFVLFNNAYYFAASTPSDGSALWTTDGTTIGTKVVVHVNTNGGDYIYNLVAFKDALYFTAFVDGEGRQMWRTDGSAAGTKLVADVNPSPNSDGDIGALTVFNGALYFTGRKDGQTRSLFKTDGTIVEEVKTFSGIAPPTEFNGMLYFAASDTAGLYGNELWRSNGTTAGTEMVSDIQSGPLGSSPYGRFAVAGSFLYFIANDGVNGVALWRSNGTTTQIVKNATTMGIDPQFFGGMYVANDTVAFMGGDLQHVQFWKTDGTGANTYKAMDITIRDHYWSMYVTPYKGEFYIRPDSVYVRPSSTVRKVDASASGLVSTFFDSPCASMLCTNSLFNSYFSLETFVFKGILYFFAPSEINGVVGVWLWKSDGTQSGTEPVQVVCNGSCPFG